MCRSRQLLQFSKLFFISSFIILFSACNEEGLVDTLTNNAPTLTGTPDTSVLVDSTYSFTPLAADADGDTLTFSINNQPPWADFDSNSGTLSGTPNSDDTGLYDNIAISVHDGNKVTSLPSFSILVYEPSSNNQVPTISGTPTTQILAGDEYSFTPLASDPDNDNLQFQVNNKPSWASFDSSTGTLSGIPQSSDANIYDNIEISVTDGSLTAYLMPFAITVSTAPVQQQQAVAMVSYNADLSEAIPVSGASLQGTVNFFFQEGSDWSTKGVNRVVFYCCKGGGSSHSVFPAGTTAPFSINVDLSQYQAGVTYELYADVFFNSPYDPESFKFFFMVTASEPSPNNQAPTISGIPSNSVNEDASYSFTPSAADTDGDNLTFSITNRPNWASFNSSTGTLAGIPTNDDVGSINNIVITVSDGYATASLPAFNITVVNVNDAPSITGSPASSVEVDTQYSFTPVANDVDGDNLLFSVNNLPLWAQFNENTGQISGTPTTVNTYSNIVISVTDGIASTSLLSFNIEVTPAPVLGSATISWTPPTEYTDQTPLTDLAGYNIYYGTTSGLYPNRINNVSPGITEYVVDGLAGSTSYYFVITSVNSVGVESEYSNEVSRSIP